MFIPRTTICHSGVGSRARLEVILNNLIPTVFASIPVVRRKAIILEAVEAICAAAAGGYTDVVADLLQRCIVSQYLQCVLFPLCTLRITHLRNSGISFTHLYQLLRVVNN